MGTLALLTRWKLWSAIPASSDRVVSPARISPTFESGVFFALLVGCAGNMKPLRVLS